MNNLRLKITLLHIEPAITRVLLVPETLKLNRLHLVIQEAMGWYNCHLHSFEAGECRWGMADPDFAMDGEEPENKTTLAQFIEAAAGEPMLYWYDFGDDWWHLIEVEDTGPKQPGEMTPKLLEVVGTCPPEDVGGPPGYARFVEVMADPSHEEHEHLKEWYGRPFNPDQPKTDELIFEVARLAKKWKPRTKSN